MHVLSARPTVAELCLSDKAIELGIDNAPPADVIPHLEVLALTLERVALILGFPLLHSSGYRCPALNAAVHGSSSSDHVPGWAEDFVCPAFGTPHAIALRLKQEIGLDFHQMILEGKPDGPWVHLSVKPTGSRRELLTAHFVDGKVSGYTPGIA